MPIRNAFEKHSMTNSVNVFFRPFGSRLFLRFVSAAVKVTFATSDVWKSTTVCFHKTNGRIVNIYSPRIKWYSTCIGADSCWHLVVSRTCDTLSSQLSKSRKRYWKRSTFRRHAILQMAKVGCSWRSILLSFSKNVYFLFGSRSLHNSRFPSAVTFISEPLVFQTESRYNTVII